MTQDRLDFVGSPLTVAVSQLGVTEDRGNKGIPYLRYAITGEDPLPWCCRFIRYCFTQAGIRLPGNRHLIANVAYLYEELTKVGAIIRDPRDVEAGDIIFLKSREKSDKGTGMHVGIVESVGALTVNSIDGNYGDKVAKVARDKFSENIAGYARWPIKMQA